MWKRRAKKFRLNGKGIGSDIEFDLEDVQDGRTVRIKVPNTLLVDLGNISGAGFTYNLTDLEDVDFSGVLDGDVIYYDDLSGKFKTTAMGNTHTHLKSAITDFVEADYLHISGAETITGVKSFRGNTYFLTNMRIADVLDDTKKISFNASGITAGVTRQIIMPDNDVDLSSVGNHDHDTLYYRQSDLYTKTELQSSGSSSVHWDNISSKPLTFTPSSHNHDDLYFTETELSTDGANLVSFSPASTNLSSVLVQTAIEEILNDNKGIQFSLTDNTSPVEGQLKWNPDNGTLEFGLKGGNVKLQIGQEQLIWVKNGEGSTILNGKAVRINGASSAVPQVVLVNNLEELSSCTIALATEDIVNNGFVTSFGLVRDINTAHLEEGKVVFLDSTDGDLTSTIPSNPSLVIKIGVCLRSHATEGIILVNIQAKELMRDRQITKEPTGFVYPDLVGISYDRTLRKVTLTGSTECYYQGRRVEEIVNGFVSPEHPISTVDEYWLSYDGTNFNWTESFPGFDVVLIAQVDNIQGVGHRECHGLQQWQGHRAGHYTIGTYRIFGGDISGYTKLSVTPADRRPDISECLILDEDLPTTNLALTNKLYTLKSITGTDLTFTPDSADIIRLNVNQPYYNQNINGVWQDTLLPANSFATVWVYEYPATSDTQSQKYRHIFLQPQSITTAVNASAGALLTAKNSELAKSTLDLYIEDSELNSEFVCIAKIVISYIGGNWQIEEVVRVTGSKALQVGSPAGEYISSVTTDETLLGSGNVLDPLRLSGIFKPNTDLEGYTFLKEDGVTSIIQIDCVENSVNFDLELLNFGRPVGMNVLNPFNYDYPYPKKYNSVIPVSDEAQIISAVLTAEDFSIIQLQANITLSNTLIINKPLKITGNFEIKSVGGASDPVVLLDITSDDVFIDSGVIIRHLKTSNTSVECAVRLNAERFISKAKVEFMETAYVLRGSFSISGETIYTGALGNNHRHFIIYSITNPSELNSVSFDSPLEATARSSFVYATISMVGDKFNSILRIVDCTQKDNTKFIRQFYLQDSWVSDLDNGLIIENCSFNAVNGDIGFLGSTDQNVLDFFGFVAILNNRAGDKATETDIYKGLLYLDGSGIVHNFGATDFFYSGNIHPTKIRSDYTSAHDDGGVAFKNTVYDNSTPISINRNTFSTNIYSWVSQLTPISGINSYVDHSRIFNRDSAGNHAIFTPLVDSATAFRFTKADLTDIVIIDSTSGFMGIGVAPVNTLTLKNSLAGIRLFSDTTGETTADGVFIGLDGSDGLLISQKENLPIGVETNSILRMLIKADGNIGIGSDTFTNKLRIASLNDSANDGVLIGGARVEGLTSYRHGYFLQRKDNALQIGNAGMSFGSHSDIDNTEYWKNVLFTNKGTDSNTVFLIGATEEIALWINNDTKIGIGVKPLYSLHIKNELSPSLVLENSTGVNKLQLLSQAGSSVIGNITETPLIFKTNDSESFRILADGKIAIGKVSASFKVDITGDVNIGASNAYRVNGVQVLTAQQNNIVALTNVYGTGDNTLQSIGASWNSTEADNVMNNFKDVSGKINEVISALKAHGLIASS